MSAECRSKALRRPYDPQWLCYSGKSHVARKAWKQNQIDRGLSATSVPQNLSIYGVYHLPFGSGLCGGDHLLSRAVLGGWKYLRDLHLYISGTPLALTSSACSSSTEPGAGQCVPDLNPSFNGKVRCIKEPYGERHSIP